MENALRTIEKRQQAKDKIADQRRRVMAARLAKHQRACPNENGDAAISGAAVQPDYPAEAREAGATGVTQVKVTLNSRGAVTDAWVYKSAGNPDLDKAAILAATATKYTPEIVNCHPISGSYIYRAEFTGE
jgi:TonB family protein